MLSYAVNRLYYNDLAESKVQKNYLVLHTDFVANKEKLYIKQDISNQENIFVVSLDFIIQ